MSTTTNNPEKYYQLGQNYPTPFLAPSVQERLTKIGGKNLYGEPNFRFVWGCQEHWFRMNGWRMKYIIGHATEWLEKQTESGLFVKLAKRIELGVPRWIVEQWYPPEHFGTPEHWNSIRYEMMDGILVDKLGAFPARGEYRHFLTLDDADGEYKYPDDDDLLFIEEAVFIHRHLKHNAEQETRDLVDGINKHREQESNWLTEAIKDGVEISVDRILDPHRYKRGGSGKRVFHDSSKQFTGENNSGIPTKLAA